MKTYNSMNNQNGGMAALLSVVILSMIMVSTLTSFYVYIENRAKFQGRIRANYQMGYVMEDISRAVVQARDQFVNGECVTGGNQDVRWIDCSQVCATKVSSLPGTLGATAAITPAFAVCIKNATLNKAINGSDYFCAFNADGGASKPSYCDAIAANDVGDQEEMYAKMDFDKKSTLEKWYSRLDGFFNTTVVKNAPAVASHIQDILSTEVQPPTFFGWMIPQKAYANPDNQGVGSHNSYGGVFAKANLATVVIGKIDNGCSAASTDPRCKKCEGNERKTGGCMKLSVCPPWLPASSCISGGGSMDRRLAQSITVPTIASVTPPELSSPPSSDPGMWCCTGGNCTPTTLPGSTGSCSYDAYRSATQMPDLRGTSCTTIGATRPFQVTGAGVACSVGSLTCASTCPGYALAGASGSCDATYCERYATGGCNAQLINSASYGVPVGCKQTCGSAEPTYFACR